ncbi:hypothetical protein MNBD_GAMMA26-569 [hydrothermal vent metagenome]|uniref:ABC transporter substrate-binding protein n=1 Tax=hydrothermal vent metagenome TaxID=652676 RepID=A0A3B1B2S0_9ZZZZ
MAYDIAILKSSNADKYDVFATAFSMAFPNENISVINMDEDIGKGRKLMEKFDKEKTDMVVALGPRAAWVSKQGHDTPVLISMLSQPGRYGLNDSPGVSLDYSMEQRLKEFIKVIPGTKRIGIIYSEGNDEFVAEAITVANRIGLKIFEKKISDITKLKGALDEILPLIDALWMRTDKVVTSNVTVVKQMIILQALQSKIPIIGSNKWAVNNGALFCLFTDYEDIGRQTGSMARRMLKGENFSMMPPARIRVFVNAYVYERLSASMQVNISDATVFAN